MYASDISYVAENQNDFRCTINFIADCNEKMTQNGYMSKTFYPELLCLPHIIISQLCCNKDSLYPLLFCTTCTLFDTVNKGIYYTIVNHLEAFVTSSSTCVVYLHYTSINYHINCIVMLDSVIKGRCKSRFSILGHYYTLDPIFL